MSFVPLLVEVFGSIKIFPGVAPVPENASIEEYLSSNIRNKNYEGILAAIACGANINNTSCNRQTPLDQGIETKSVLITELLLLNGANVNQPVPLLDEGAAINRAIMLNHIGLGELRLKSNPPNGSVGGHGSLKNHALTACRCVTTLL